MAGEDFLVSAIMASAQENRIDARKTLHAIIQAMTDTLANGGHVDIQDFGLLNTRELPARNSVNPNTKQVITVPAKVYAQFYAYPSLRDSVA